MFYSVNIKTENYKGGKWEEKNSLNQKTIFVFALNDDDAIKQIDACIEYHSDEKVRAVKDGKILKGHALLQIESFGNSVIRVV